MAEKKYLIVNADDFGQSPGVNRGVIEAHRRGIVTSASLMVRWPAAKAAATYSREHGTLSLGLHFDAGEWTFRDGAWTPLYEAVPLNDAVAVRSEVARQLATFRRLAGADPTHIDSHQHVHLREPARAALLETSDRLGVPLRHFSAETRYCGDFYGQTAEGLPLPHRISVEGLIKLLAALPAGVTELGCHPGLATDLDTMYRDERAQEATVLCDPRVREALASMEIELLSFRGRGRLAGATENDTRYNGRASS